MFSTLLREGHYEQAEALLVSEIRKAELVDPADDFSWGVAADALAYRLLEDRGAKAFCDYHQRLLDLFVVELEPRWGHLHKGHLHYRLASGSFADDFPAGIEHLRAAVAEDALKEASSADDTDRGESISAAAIALALLERVQADHDATPSWPQLLAGLPWLRFEVALENMTVAEGETDWALGQILPEAALVVARRLHRELDTAVALRMVHGLPVLLSEYLTRLLHGSLGASLNRPPLGDGPSGQLEAAVAEGRLPSAAMISAFRLAAMWQASVHIHAADGAVDNRIEETDRLITVTLKVMVDRAVFDWATTLGS